MTPAAILDLVAVFIFALTGGLVASRAQLDIVGFLFSPASPASGAVRSATWCSGGTQCSGSAARTTSQSPAPRRSWRSSPPTAQVALLDEMKSKLGG